jgi:nucleoside-diphosphate-sugar epimerase
MTGEGGFVGSTAATYFLEQGWNVVGLFHQDRAMIGDQEQTLKLRLQEASLMSRMKPHHRMHFTAVYGDMMDRDAMRVLFQTYRPDTMIHAAALLVPPTQQEYPDPVQFRQEIDKLLKRK